MKKLIAALPLGLLLAATQAEARSFAFHGNVCRPVGGQTGCTEAGQYGVNNICQFAITVECPLPISTATGIGETLTGGYFVAYDRSQTADVACTLVRNDFKGDVVYQESLSTSGFGAAPVSKFFATGQAVSGFWRLRCTLPTLTSDGITHLTSILITTSGN